jgi:hypothetical protein
MEILPTLYLSGQVIEVLGAGMLFLFGTPKHVLTNSVWGNVGDK